LAATAVRSRSADWERTSATRRSPGQQHLLGAQPRDRLVEQLSRLLPASPRPSNKELPQPALAAGEVTVAYPGESRRCAPTASSDARRTSSPPTGRLREAGGPNASLPAPARPADRAETSPETAPSQAAAQTPAGCARHCATHQLLVKAIEEEEPLQRRPRRRPVEPAIRSRLLITEEPHRHGHQRPPSNLGLAEDPAQLHLRPLLQLCPYTAASHSPREPD
jgi:hypothetical protein